MWILILTAVIYGGVGVTSAEFSSKQACENAKAIMEEKGRFTLDYRGICISKDNNER